MNYPEQLLPRQNFKQITANLSGYFLCRKVLDKTLIQEPLPAILPEELLGIATPNDCFDYSTNLPGVFELDHNKIEFVGDQKAYFRNYWDWISEVTTPFYRQDFIINENTGWFFLTIDKINGLTIPFNRKSQLPLNETATAVVVHTSSNSNFWHFSIKWIDANGYISTTNSKWKNHIVATVRALFSELVLLEYPGQQIPENFYKKN